MVNGALARRCWFGRLGGGDAPRRQRHAMNVGGGPCGLGGNARLSRARLRRGRHRTGRLVDGLGGPGRTIIQRVTGRGSRGGRDRLAARRSGGSGGRIEDVVSAEFADRPSVVGPAVSEVETGAKDAAGAREPSPDDSAGLAVWLAPATTGDDRHRPKSPTRCREEQFPGSRLRRAVRPGLRVWVKRQPPRAVPWARHCGPSLCGRWRSTPTTCGGGGTWPTPGGGTRSRPCGAEAASAAPWRRRTTPAGSRALRCKGSRGPLRCRAGGAAPAG